MALLDLQGLSARQPEMLQGLPGASTLTIGCGSVNLSNFSLFRCTF
jgi:hypothetical protein